MGNIRTPKPVYFDGGVIEYFVKEKLIWYRILIWTKDGTKQFEFERGYAFGKKSEDLVKRTLQSFSSAGVIEN